VVDRVEGALHPQPNLQHKTLKRHHSQIMDFLRNQEQQEEEQFAERTAQ